MPCKAAISGKEYGYRIINLVRRTEAVAEVEATAAEGILIDDAAPQLHRKVREPRNDPA